MLLIIGCGFLGTYLLKHITEHSQEKVIATVRSKPEEIKTGNVEYVQCDLTNSNDIANLREKCANELVTVFYFAACHDIDYVYENPKEARSVNVVALESFIDNFPNIEKLFFASTDCVYGEGKNKDNKLKEDSVLNPINEYGVQKKQAEEIVLKHNFTILRFPFMFGPSLMSKSHFYDKICDFIKNGNMIELTDGMKRSAISYKKAAELIYMLYKSIEDIPNIINICGDEVVSKYRIGCMIAESLACSKTNIKKITEREAKKFFKDKRASCIAMDNSLLKSILRIEKIELEI